MTDMYEVIAAFADGERVEASALKEALADPAGREYLTDLVALREVVQRGEPSTLEIVRPSRRPLRWLAAAVMALALGAGLFYTTTRDSNGPPHPDRVITLERGVDWTGN